MSKIELYSALKMVAKRDAGDDRKNTFSHYLEHHFFARLICKVYELSPSPLKVVMLFSYSLLQNLRQRAHFKKNQSLICAKFSNESEELIPYLEKSSYSHIEWSSKNIFLNILTLLKEVILFPRIYSILFKFSKKPFFIATRQSELLLSYIHYHFVFQKSSPRSLVIFSESAPYSLGPAIAAKKHSIKTIFFSHGYPVKFATGLSFDVNFLSGPDAYSIHQSNGKVSGEIHYKGIVGDNIPFTKRDNNNDLLILASLLLDVEYLKSIYPMLSKNFSNLYIRVHPKSKIINPNIFQELENSGFQVLSNEVSMESQIKRCRYILSGHTSAALRAVKLGSYTIYDEKLDKDDKELFSFFKKGLFFDMKDWNSISVNEVQNFYQKDAWNRLILEFDPFYNQSNDIKEASFKKVLKAHL